MKKLIKFVFIFILSCHNSFSEDSKINLIQDTEIENFLNEISKPIFKSANLNEKNIKFFIVNDNSINAFVTNGQNIFINTGTLTGFDTPDAILGIIAHETGHIAGGHIARSTEVYSNIANISIGSILLGVGALLAGVPEIGETIIFGTMQFQQQSALKYTREQEENADGLAVQYLNDNELSSKALLYSMDKFYMQELDYENNLEYYSTHPLSRNRKQFIENKMKNENFSNESFNKEYKDKFNFIKAKILAYQINQSGSSQINVRQGSDYEIYARAIINTNRNRSDLAFVDCDYLIRKYKTNPYFYELKGDIYLKLNDARNALKNYEKSDQLIDGDDVLIKKMISYIIIKYNQKQMYQDAIEKLNFIVQKNEKDNSALKLLAEVYYKDRQLDLSYLNLAKYYLNLKNDIQAEKYIKLAEKNTNNPEILMKIEDLKNFNKK